MWGSMQGFRGAISIHTGIIYIYMYMYIYVYMYIYIYGAYARFM